VDLVLRRRVIFWREFSLEKNTSYETRYVIFYVFVRNVCLYTLLYPKETKRKIVVINYIIYTYLLTYLLTHSMEQIPS